MRNLLSQIFLIALIFVTAMPTSLLAQNTWNPPTEPAVGGNTPSAINVSPFGQTKEGRLTIDGGFVSNTGSNLNGMTMFDISPSQPNNPAFNQVFSFLKTYFLNNVQIGSEGTVGPSISLIGQLRYKPTDSLGVSSAMNGMEAIAPQPGRVLTSLDTLGTVGWRPGLPSGNAAGDTLIWDINCQCWVTGPGGGTGTATLPPGNTGQTVWYSAPNVLQATDQIKHDVDGGFARTSLNNPKIELNGSNFVKVGVLNQGLTAISSDVVKISGRNGVDIGSSAALQPIGINSPEVNFGQMPASDYQTVNVKSGNVNFARPDDGGYQTVTFESDAVKFKNINMNPGTGYLPYSLDDEGRFSWNENLTYQLNQGGLFPYPMGQLTLANPESGIAVLQNQGVSHLMGDVLVGVNGDLYLEGIGAAQPSQMGQNIIKPLCYITTTKKVVTCDDDPIEDTGGAIGDDPNPVIEYPTDFEILRTHDDSPGSYTFQADQTVTVEWCGGGGGGGGGGLGGDTSGGGGGGGGGSAGNCSTQQLDVTAGDVLSWDIGAGGAKGLGGWWREDLLSPGAGFNQNRIPTPGGAGAPTLIYFSNDGAAPTQVGQMQIGGTGGSPGMGANSIGGGSSGGPGADSTLPAWHDGSPGHPEVSALSNEGGHGGDGESTAGSISSWLVPSAGGKGGIYGSLVAPDGGAGGIIQNWAYGDYANRWGGDGQNGNPGQGAGGGGGGYGETVDFPGQLVGNPPNGPGDYSERRARDGGEGGSGYVRISGLYNAGGSTGVDYTTPGVYTLNVGSIPLSADTVDIEIWGAGGGGGGVKTGLFANRLGGGGGAGGYVKINDIPRSLLEQTPGPANQSLTITVGSGGIEGDSSSNPTNGGNGGVTRIRRSDGVDLVLVGGGFGGSKDDTSGGHPYGAGGLGGGFSIFTGIATNPTADIIQQTQGASGQGATATFSGNSGGTGTSGIGNGGGGADTDALGGVGNEAGVGYGGKVIISW